MKGEQFTMVNDAPSNVARGFAIPKTDNIEKSHIKQHLRKTKSGSLSTVKEHEDSRHVPMDKDRKRIEKIANSRDPEKRTKMTRNMAEKIMDYDKAMRRGNAMEDENYHGLAEIFFDRARDLRNGAVSRTTAEKLQKREEKEAKSKYKNLKVGDIVDVKYKGKVMSGELAANTPNGYRVFLGTGVLTGEYIPAEDMIGKKKEESGMERADRLEKKHNEQLKQTSKVFKKRDEKKIEKYKRLDDGYSHGLDTREVYDFNHTKIIGFTVHGSGGKSITLIDLIDGALKDKIFASREDAFRAGEKIAKDWKQFCIDHGIKSMND